MEGASSRGSTRHGLMVFLVVAIAVANVRRLLEVKFNVLIFLEFNNYRESQADVTLFCMNEITGGRTPERSVMPFVRVEHRGCVLRPQSPLRQWNQAHPVSASTSGPATPVCRDPVNSSHFWLLGVSHHECENLWASKAPSNTKI